eukprot:Cvel_31689.t1-p1 / transcript=Cvel_31689.t1 / gene=Cvel_31689 / organism=Chromera_velia_CCMP2878 / gene_product=hypothetical protein / transcript_product=hypothetical protein / location=Cvel_scaffold4769:5005-7885(+) / protein_length=504 / sequence_SO=supercontig / SO=protein_coding / is_pseudo=false
MLSYPLSPCSPVSHAFPYTCRRTFSHKDLQSGATAIPLPECRPHPSVIKPQPSAATSHSRYGGLEPTSVAGTSYFDPSLGYPAWIPPEKSTNAGGVGGAPPMTTSKLLGHFGGSPYSPGGKPRSTNPSTSASQHGPPWAPEGQPLVGSPPHLAGTSAGRLVDDLHSRHRAQMHVALGARGEVGSGWGGNAMGSPQRLLPLPRTAGGSNGIPFVPHPHSHFPPCAERVMQTGGCSHYPAYDVTSRLTAPPSSVAAASYVPVTSVYPDMGGPGSVMSGQAGSRTNANVLSGDVPEDPRCTCHLKSRGRSRGGGAGGSTQGRQAPLSPLGGGPLSSVHTRSSGGGRNSISSVPAPPPVPHPRDASASPPRGPERNPPADFPPPPGNDVAQRDGEIERGEMTRQFEGGEGGGAAGWLGGGGGGESSSSGEMNRRDPRGAGEVTSDEEVPPRRLSGGTAGERGEEGEGEEGGRRDWLLSDAALDTQQDSATEREGDTSALDGQGEGTSR